MTSELSVLKIHVIKKILIMLVVMHRKYGAIINKELCLPTLQTFGVMFYLLGLYTALAKI
jgi:hypothetical protein